MDYLNERTQNHSKFLYSYTSCVKNIQALFCHVSYPLTEWKSLFAFLNLCMKGDT